MNLKRRGVFGIAAGTATLGARLSGAMPSHLNGPSEGMVGANASELGRLAKVAPEELVLRKQLARLEKAFCRKRHLPHIRQGILANKSWSDAFKLHVAVQEEREEQRQLNPLRRALGWVVEDDD